METSDRLAAFLSISVKAESFAKEPKEDGKGLE
jgi:hypothetical protein